MTGSDGLRVLIAPDCYGDSLTAVQAAEAIADGWRRARPDDELTLAPQSDGGPGFVDVLAGRLGERRTLRVSGPLTAEVDADWVFDDAAPRHRLHRVCAGLRVGAAGRTADRADRAGGTQQGSRTAHRGRSRRPVRAASWSGWAAAPAPTAAAA